MSTAAWRIAQEEWRYWSRSRTGVAAAAVIVLLVLTSAVTTYQRVESERETRTQLQAKAEETFLSQPDRHPHRMVHYGHYVFRAPVPLAIADPGVDPFTGTVMFLEGHRQNSPTFAPRYTQAQAGPLAELSPALTYQLLVPLLLIVVGFASLAREREAATDQLIVTMSVSPGTLWLGKSLALAAVALIVSLPLAVLCAYAWRQGESGGIALLFWLGYLAYLLCWSLIITAGSAWARRTATSLFLLLACWLAISLLLPRLASSAADAQAPLNSKVYNDLQLAQEIRDDVDGHNASDPGFAALRSALLAQYDVDSVDDLPVNFRGIAAETAEASLTETMNRFAQRRADQEQAQVGLANRFNWLSPFLALRTFSITTAGSDLTAHHRFLSQAEAIRFAFVQRLNRVHTNELSYTVDMNRSNDDASSQRARVDSHHWRVLDDIDWAPASPAERIAGAVPALAALLLWTLIAALAGWLGTRRATWSAHG
jgi:ABC-2 type transport system permease protein